MTQRIYLDTSVLSALDDDRAPERRALTREFWSRRAEFELISSQLIIDEINDTPTPSRRAQMHQHTAELTLLPIADAARLLAARYIAAAVFTRTMQVDALHVASAVIARCDAPLSWNFIHLVNRQRHAAANAVNLAAGMPTIEIISPPEL